jgi:amidophosphoribosyltransferase
MGGFFCEESLENCASDILYGTDYHFHLGTVFGGVVIVNEGEHQRKIHSLETEYFRPQFEKWVLDLKGKRGLGVISDNEVQPLKIKSHLGTYTIAHIGKIGNSKDLEEKVIKGNGFRGHFSEIHGREINGVEVLAALINQRDNFEHGIECVQNEIKGSSSIIILTDEGIYLSRDRFGRTPIVVGERKNDKKGRADAIAASLDTSAFQNLGFKPNYFLGPGEIGRISGGKYEQLKKPGNTLAICSFLWVYYGYPPSKFENISTEVMRNRSGKFLYESDKLEGIVKELDIVAGIPDSGTGHAIGYANASMFPYGRPIIKYTPTWPRSFMPQEQSIRDLVAKMKLLVVEDLIRGMRDLFCEDSIVRGTQLKDNINFLFEELGALEVHMRPACPPLIYGCNFLNFSRSKSESELAARRAIENLHRRGQRYELERYADDSTEQYVQMREEIEREFTVTSLRYQKLGKMVEAIGLPKTSLCTHCWDGCSAGVCSDKLYTL